MVKNAEKASHEEFVSARPTDLSKANGFEKRARMKEPAHPVRDGMNIRSRQTLSGREYSMGSFEGGIKRFRRGEFSARQYTRVRTGVGREDAPPAQNGLKGDGAGTRERIYDQFAWSRVLLDQLSGYAALEFPNIRGKLVESALCMGTGRLPASWRFLARIHEP
jgi:hypothetical protein